MRVEPVIERLKLRVAALGGRVEGAAELAALVQEDILPDVTPAGYVLPLGLQGGVSDAATGLFRQSFSETIAVVLMERGAGDATGALALKPIDALIDATVLAIAGWAPNDEVGVFELRRGALLSLKAGAVMYQLDFAISDQLRITET